MTIKNPYLLFLGDAADQLAAKTAQGVKDWRPEWCLGQLRMENCNADLGLPDIGLEAAYEQGARTLVIGIANRGGVISDAWTRVMEQALRVGFDLAAGLHGRLVDVPVLRQTAAELGRQLHDVRHPSRSFSVASGERRPGKRILAVGTDCSIGKMYTMLAMERDMRARGMNADFRATGQTGILIAGDGVSIDAVVADFISGAVEAIAPANDPDHWDLVEGQGSLFHISYAGVSLGLLHGAQADALVLCHEPTRRHMRGLPDYSLPSLQDCMAANLAAARLTNPLARFVGLAINTSSMDPDSVAPYLQELSNAFDLPAVDPFKQGTGHIIEHLV